MAKARKVVKILATRGRRVARRSADVMLSSMLDLTSIVSDIVGIFIRKVSSTPFVLSVALVATVLYVTEYHWDDSFLGSWCHANPTNKFCSLLVRHFHRFQGFLALVPNVFAVRSAAKSIILFGAIAFVAMVPVIPLWDYLLLSTAVLVATNAQRSPTKLFAILAVTAVYYLGWMTWPSTGYSSIRSHHRNAMPTNSS